jgi:hypothetical protein
MTAELNALGALAGNVAKTARPQKLKLKKKTKEKLSESSKNKSNNKSESTGKTPSATNVREALAEGKITPLEAADLNPRGGLKPKASDVRAAYKSRNISAEEAYDLNPGASLNKERVSKSSSKDKDEEPIKVSSERIYPKKEEPKGSPQLGFNKKDLPTYGPGSEYNPNAGRQWNNG